MPTRALSPALPAAAAIMPVVPAGAGDMECWDDEAEGFCRPMGFMRGVVSSADAATRALVVRDTLYVAALPGDLMDVLPGTAVEVAYEAVDDERCVLWIAILPRRSAAAA